MEQEWFLLHDLKPAVSTYWRLKRFGIKPCENLRAVQH